MTPRVYVSLPLSGSSARHGREVLRGVELALEQARPPGPELVVLDAPGSWTPEDLEAAAQNADRAAADPAAVAYIGEFHSVQVSVSAPILSAAGLLQVAPVATYTGLGGETLVLISPSDEGAARAIAAWLAEHGVAAVLVVHDYGDEYGEPVAAMCVAAAAERGIAVRSRRVWDHDDTPEADLGDAEAVLYVGVAGSGATGLWERLHAAKPDLWLLGSDGVAAPWLAAEMSATAAARTRFFVAQRASFDLYGYEALTLVLDGLGGAADRAALVHTVRATRDRDSVIGRYSLDADGRTTTEEYGRLAVVDGVLVWDGAERHR